MDKEAVDSVIMELEKDDKFYLAGVITTLAREIKLKDVELANHKVSEKKYHLENKELKFRNGYLKNVISGYKKKLEEK